MPLQASWLSQPLAALAGLRLGGLTAAAALTFTQATHVRYILCLC